MGPATSPVTADPGGTGHTQRILYPVFGSVSDATFETALQIAAGVDGRLVLLDLIGADRSVSEETRTTAGTALEPRLDDVDHVDTSYHVESTANPVADLRDYARQRDVSLVVFDDQVPRTPTDVMFGSVPERIESQGPWDVVTVTGGQPTRRVASVLVPLSDSPHATLAAKIAGAIALEANAALDLFHVSRATRERKRDSIEALFQTARQQIPENVDVGTWVLPAPSVTQAILNQSRHYDLTVIGETQHGRLRRLLTGSLPATVRSEARNRVLTVKHSEGGGFMP